VKIAYFDCFSGVSGDMILGALLDAGLDIQELESELGKLKISGYKIKTEQTARKGISGTKFSVDVIEQNARKRLKDIVEIADQSDLDDDIKDLSKKTFKELATVEAKLHGKSIEAIHFHEVGGLDSIIDVIGSFIGIKKLGIEATYSSKIHVGTGFLECRHGVLPVPAPATLELLKGIPIYSKGIEAELATPTGVCILKTLSQRFGIMPEMKVEKVGYGAGSRELEIPNLLRVYVGESDEDEYEKDEVILIETNIDDMNPEFYEYIMARLFENDAVDVFLTPIQMKRARPATLLTVIVAAENLSRVLEVIFSETTTLGVRTHEARRYKLAREGIVVETEHGKIKVKLGKLEGAVVNFAPEYEDCRRVADEKHIPIKRVYEAAKQAAVKMTRA